MFIQSLLKIPTRKIALFGLSVTIFATSSFLTVYALQSSSTGSSSTFRGDQIKKWQRWHKQRQFAHHLHDEASETPRKYKDEWKKRQNKMRMQQPQEKEKEQIDNDLQSSKLLLQPNNEAKIIHKSQSSEQPDEYQQHSLLSKEEDLAMIQETIQKSLKEKYHIQWEYDQLKQQKQSPERRMFPLTKTLFTDSSWYPQHVEHNNKHRDEKDDNNTNNNNQRRRLEDALDNAYNTGRPGSTYGSTMFCGSSWAEASTSCNQRQNCPSGQSDECITPGHECWAFTECDTRRGDGEQFSEMHGVTGAENLQASGIGAQASGGFVDLSKPSPDKTDHYFCGRGYDDAVSQCASHCPSGSLMDCPSGEICFFNTPCDARMMTKAPSPPSPTVSPTTPAPVIYASKLNKYFCGYDWDDAQERCEVWCPSGSDDHCPDDQLCFAFSKCHAVEMNAMTLEQMDKQKQQYIDFNNQLNNNNQVNAPSGSNEEWWAPGSGGNAPSPGASNGGGMSNVGNNNYIMNGRTFPPTQRDEVPGYYDVKLGGTTRPTRQPTKRPTNKPSINAEQAMHRYSFCGAFWTDARDNCETKEHCEDDRDCPEFEFCWTQTPCDYYATETPTTTPPTYLPTIEPTDPSPTRKPTNSPIGFTPSKSPTPDPTWEPTISPTYYPTMSPTVTAGPTAKPTFDPDDPSLTFFCGFSWAQADETCGMRCPSGNSEDCPGEFECWAFTSCQEEKGIVTTMPTYAPTPQPFVVYVPGFNGAQVPVFGGTDYSQFEPTKSPSPTSSGQPSIDPTLPPGVVAKEMLATYYCGIDWVDVETNCHQACPGGSNMECENPEHSCWAFVHACRAKTAKPTGTPVTETPTRTPVTNPPTRDGDSPTTPQPTGPPTDLYGLLEGQKGKFYCSATWSGIVCGKNQPCPSGDDTDCPTGQSCFSSTIDCSEPQPPPPSPPPSTPPTKNPTPRPTQPTPAQTPSANDSGNQAKNDVNNNGEDWDSTVENQSDAINNEGEDWDSTGKESNAINNEGEDWDSTVENQSNDINNEGEDWDSTVENQSNLINNEGEDWQQINNDGEDWSLPKPTAKPSTPRPTWLPTEPVPTPDPTPEPTMDLIDHLENLKTTYFCSESWDNIDCANAQACPSGESKDCPKKQQCFSGTPCKVEKPPSKDEASPGKKPVGRPTNPDESPSPTIWTPLMGAKEDGSSSENSGKDDELEVDEISSKFFCGLSWASLVEDCDNAKPCPSGTNAECEGGQSCFANSPCADEKEPDEEVEETVGVFNFASMVGNIPSFCRDKKTMSRNVGYWQSWSIYRSETCNPFTAGSIDASSYTHIVFSFASISKFGTLEPWDFEEDIKGGQYQQFLDMRDKYPGTKAMVAVGGWTHNEPDNERLYRFSNSAATPKSRMKLAQSTVAFMRKYGFDGLDIDWEYPGDEARGGNATIDKENLVLLCDELRKYFDDAPEKFDLSIAIPASIPRFEAGFDLYNLTRSIHFFNIMAYDLHGTWDKPAITGAHSDIGGISEVIGYMINNSTVPPAQIVLGMPAYGRSYTMANVTKGNNTVSEDDTCLSLGCPFEPDSNETAIGGCLDTNGFVPFVELYNWEKEGEGKGYDSLVIDFNTYSTVMVKDNDQLISYDNAETFKAKVDYATNNCLGGTMVWAIDMLPLKTQSTGGGKGKGGGGKGGGSSGSGGGGSGTGDNDDDAVPQNLLSEEESVRAYCGQDWDDAISTCNRPCPSGLSDDCEQGETCFAGTSCAEGGVIAIGDTCKICPDTSTQGVLSWVEIEVTIGNTTTSTTCGELDYGLLRSVTKTSETCDAVKLDFSSECCYNYPEDQCSLCRKGYVYYNVRSELNVTMPDGTDAPCGLVDKMLKPEENSGEKCVTMQDSFFDACCYQQCSLCEGKGIKWWLEFEGLVEGRTRRVQGNEEPREIGQDNMSNGGEDEGKNSENTVDNKGENFDADQDDDEEENEEDEEEQEEEITTCSSIDASLYSDFIEADTEECLEIKSDYSTECCYTFPTNACGLCKEGDTMLTLLWNSQVEHNGRNVSCGIIDNILNAEEEGSSICTSAKDTHFDDCCFDKCNLCDNTQLAWDFVIDYYNDTTKTCGDISAIFAAEEIKSNTKECSSVKADYQELCCFTPPITPCDLCPEYIRWDEGVEFEGEESTCKEASAFLKREEEFSDKCSSARENMAETCCYELCDICGESLMLDWDAVIEYEGDRMACGDLKPIFGRNEIEEGTESCSAIKDTYRDFCCYTPPSIPCNLCQTESAFLDAYSSVEIDFWGSKMNCSDAYDYLVRRIESDSDTCSSAKESVAEECCYDKCKICGGNQLQDFEQTIELNDEIISCQQLVTVRTSDISANSSQCTSMQSKFSETCCYDAPDTPCVLCKAGAVRKELQVDFNGATDTCQSVANYLANRANNGTDECSAATAEFQESCCFDKCGLCPEGENIDWDSFVEFDGKEEVSCGSFDWYFTSNAIEKGMGQCVDLQVALSDTCCYKPIDYSVPACSVCKQGDTWYDIDGDSIAYFEGRNATCTEISNSLFRKAEDDSGFCTAAKAEYFPSCCFQKCDLCQGAQLDANVEIAYNGSAATCLELGFKFVADIVAEGSEECIAARAILYEPCCYATPIDPCVLCQSSASSQGDVRDGVSVSFYGSTTNCLDLNSFLVSREEQVGFICQAAKTELQESCCFQECKICGSGGQLYWDNPTTFNDITFACGELTWVLSGSSMEEGSEECAQMQTTYYDDCCSGPSALIPDAGNRCEICPSGKDWYAQVVHSDSGKPMTCLELDSVLLQSSIFDDTAECEQAKSEYSSQCCYEPPERPCNLCQSGQTSYSVLDQTVSYNGAETNCYGIYNYLYTRMETEDDACLVTQNDLFEQCCYAKCTICEDYQLDQEAAVVHEGTSMGCSEIQNNFIGLNQITKGTEECGRIQQEHWNDCCYDVACNLCSSGETNYELLVDERVFYMGVERDCGDWSILAERGLSQSTECKRTQSELFDRCCFKECNLCKEQGTSINWNQPLFYDGLASTCLDVYMNLRSEKVHSGDDRCQSVQFAVSEECCSKLPSNQCSLCQTSNGTFLNTNWNSEVNYLGEQLTCSDINAMLSTEELGSLLCLSARDDFWYQCCTPQFGGGNTGLGGILPGPEVSDSTGEPAQSGEAGQDPSGGASYDHGFTGTTFFRRNSSNRTYSTHPLAMVLPFAFVTLLMLS